MSIKENDVRYVARLARIKLSEDEVRLFARQLDDILAYVDKLNEKLKIEKNTEPLSYIHPPANPHRQDAVKKCISGEAALKNAPQKKGVFFKVPRIIEE